MRDHTPHHLSKKPVEVTPFELTPTELVLLLGVAVVIGGVIAWLGRGWILG